MKRVKYNEEESKNKVEAKEITPKTNVLSLIAQYGSDEESN